MKRKVGYVLLFIAITSIVYAVPTEFDFQGRLTNEYGAVLDTTLTVVFQIYCSERDGTPIWEETQSVEFDEGLFHVLLGDICPIPSDSFTGEFLYLQMVVDGDTLLPRRPFVSVPYAFKSVKADTAMYALNAEPYDSSWYIDIIESVLDTFSVASVSYTHLTLPTN